LLVLRFASCEAVLDEDGLPEYRSERIHEKHSIVLFFLGKHSLLVLRFTSCEAILDEGWLPEHRSELYSRKTQHRVALTGG
jgi:hypothetical protein